MKTFVVIPAAYGATYTFQAEKIDVIGKEVITLGDDKGGVAAVISLANIAALFLRE